MTAVATKRLRALVPRAPRRHASLAPLIGRDTFVSRVERELESARLVTLMGPPGIGKTRLAQACLDHSTSSFGESRWFCDLTSAKTEDELRFAILTALQDRFLGEHLAGASAEARVIESLVEAGRALLVLDNFEQLVFAATVIERLCEAAPELRVLVTSRERLAVAGEVVIELAPLEESDAVRLFSKRAADAGGSVGDDPSALERIVRRLEGIPLAIELAAARTRLISPRELADRLEVGQSVLTGAARRPEDRHATLASAIEWSWSLLSAAEQTALGRCSVFANGFTLHAAERVIGEGAVELLGALRDKSLVHSTGDGRLALYVSIREFAIAKLRALAPDAEADACGRHAVAFGELARGFNEWRNLQDREPKAALHAALRKEKENLVAALAFARETGLSAHATELAVAVAALHALPSEQCIEELTASLSEERDPKKRALVLITRQSVHGSLGHYEASLADLATLRADGDVPKSFTLLALVYEGIQLRYQGYPKEAWSRHAEAAAELEPSELLRLRAMNAACMGRLQFDLGDLEASRLHNGRALDLADSLDDSWLGALALANLAQLEQEVHDFERSEELFKEALARLREVGEIYEAIYSGACGDLFFEWGKLDVARRWYDESVRFFRGLMAHRHASLAHAAAAALEAMDGEHARAKALLAIARRSASRAKNRVVDVGVELHAGTVEIASSDEASRAAVIATWRRKVEPWREVIATSFDARFALRMLERAIARFSPKTSAAPPRTLTIASDGRWFDAGDGVRVELGRRGSLRRILLALVAHRLSHPNEGMKQSELVAAGWPGERVLVDAASTRVRVAIASLRQLGLRSVLLTRDDGYVIDAHVSVERVASPQPP